MAKPTILQRVMKRLGYAPVGGTRTYAAGAQFNRLNADWIRSAASIDQEVRSDIRVLRRRARELARDNAYARQFIRLIKTNIIGPQGIRPVPCNAGTDGGPSKANLAIAKAWADWSHPENASTDGRMSWPEMQRLIIASLATDGEVIVRRWKGADNEYGFALELIDPDLLDETFARARTNGENEIRMGVEVDRFQRPVAYHLWKFHPSEQRASNERIRVPASEISHLFVPLRAGQTRGISWFAPVLLDEKMLAGYQEAELVAARTAAAKMGFFETDAEHADAYQAPNNGEALVMNASPGVAEQLPPGVTFKSWDPQHPSAAFDVFVKAILRSIAMGLGVSYISLTGDLSSANYSSARVGLLAERDEYETIQTYLAEHLHRLVYRDWLEMAVLSPRLSLPSRDAQRWQDVWWHARGWAWIDPLKDIQAVEAEIKLGLNSRTRAAREMGREYAEILPELAAEEDAADKAGVNVSGSTPQMQKPDEAPEEDTPTTKAKPARTLRAVAGGMA